MAAPTVLADALCAQYGLEQVGVIDSIVEQIYAVTVERRVHHPALRRILERAPSAFGQAPS
jgi:LysR family transcriptional activator of nhaA